MLGAFLCTGAWLTLRSRAFQIRRAPFWWRQTFSTLLRKREAAQGSISQRQALMGALAACLGTGNIIGVATALQLGGPGAIFWMWLSAALGMMTCCAENILGTKFRWRLPGGGWMGGPMAYLSKALGSKALAAVYAALLVLAALGMGNMTQANAVTEAVRSLAALGGLRVAPAAVGAVLAVLLGLVIFGGVGRVARCTERLVPFMTGAFLLACLAILCLRLQAVPAALGSIFREAFTFPAAAGGGAAWGIRKALRYGVARGVFSNEAGLGSSAVMHAAAEVDRPARQGLWGIAEVFIDTILMCTVTGLALLCCGSWSPGGAVEGVAAVGQAFSSVLGSGGHVFVSISVALFAFATLTGWSYYGEQGCRYLFGEKSVRSFRIIYLLAAVLGSALRMETVWNAADILNALMAIPNLLGVLALSGVALRELKAYESMG
ncbi:MAG: amino acid carrier protein [Oscillospiraceae bacterium]|jgi:AGCS family alanine or glycine:cation symporter|nr:amino acid carrier protein [Oscillospiraceae bacterium]